MIILGIESTCDETAAAIVQEDDFGVKILSKNISSSAEIQAKFGGVIPDQTAREQLKLIIPVISKTLDEAQVTIEEIDAIAVAQGPGLIGSLLIGVETAKALATAWNKPLIPVNHLIAHFYANWIGDKDLFPKFPCIGLLISGGHTDLILMRDHGDYEYLGGTRDDAAGECFDKCARLLNLPYPGGPNLSKLAQNGDPKRFELPKSMWYSGDLDFSFSGLKTAFKLIVENDLKLQKGHFDKEKNLWIQESLESQLSSEGLKNAKDLAASLEQNIIDTLIHKSVLAIQKHNIEQLLIAGGVASNRNLSEKFSCIAQEKKFKLFIPAPELCTDNAVTTATAALFLNKPRKPQEVEANPNLSLKP